MPEASSTRQGRILPLMPQRGMTELTFGFQTFSLRKGEKVGFYCKNVPSLWLCHRGPRNEHRMENTRETLGTPLILIEKQLYLGVTCYVQIF